VTTCIVTFSLAFVVAYVGTHLARMAALRLRIVDAPDQFRKLHQREMPLLGGVAVFVGFMTPVGLLCFAYRNSVSELLRARPAEMAALAIGSAVILGLGIVDDVRSVPARWKLGIQLVAATAAFAGGHRITAVTNPFGRPFVLGWLSYPATVFWLLGCANAVNLLDGLDGLAAGVCLFASITLFLVSLLAGNVMSMVLLACLSGAILGFLLLNFHPAKIFLGDSGSMLLGFVVGLLSLMGARKTEASISLLVPVIALGLPILDTVTAILRRWSRKLPISAADRHHIHHRLLGMGLSQRQAVLVLYMACVVLCAAALLTTAGRDEVTLMVVGSLGVVAFVCVRVFGRLRLLDLVGRVSEDLAHSSRASAARMAIEQVEGRMRRAQNVLELWSAATGAFECLELDHAVLHLRTAEGQARSFAWHGARTAGAEAEEHGPDSWSARLSVERDGRVVGELRLAKSVRGSALRPEVPELVDRLRWELAGQVERFTPGAGQPAVARASAA
jgi:UDP-GlcNAc:undecaprenyl-phosphate GlcNAc-1-phosphate transferase